MGTKPASAVFGTELPKTSHTEVSRIIREAERMRAEYSARLLRSVGRRLAYWACAALTIFRVQRPRERTS